MTRPVATDPLLPFPVRLPRSLVERLRAEAVAGEVTNSDVIRSYIRLVDAKPLAQPRRVRAHKYQGEINRADPDLMRQIAAIGNNLNQLAHGVHASNLAGEPIAKVHILSVLASIEKRLVAIGASNAS